MSNKVVPAVYRTIIDSVIESVRPEFDEVGIEEAVLAELLRSWEYKVATSRVADFSQDEKMGEAARLHPMLPTAGNGRAGAVSCFGLSTTLKELISNFLECFYLGSTFSNRSSR